MEITKKNPDNSWWLRAGPDNEENWGVEGEHRWLVIQRQLHLLLISRFAEIFYLVMFVFCDLRTKKT